MTAGRFFGVLVRFVTGVAIAGGAGLAAYEFLGGLAALDMQARAIELPPLLAALACAAVVGFAVAFALSRPAWRRVLWGTRAWLLCLATLGFIYWRASTWREWLIFAGLAWAGLVAHHVAHRHALGWFIDDRGERQKVDHLNRGRAIFSRTTRSERLVEEGIARSSRRKALAITLLLGAPLAYGAYHLYQGHDWMAAAFVGLFGTLLLLLGALPCFVRELLYQIGYQDMLGAKVLDPEVKRPGLQEIAQEMAHGDASIADELEALGILNRGR